MTLVRDLDAGEEDVDAPDTATDPTDEDDNITTSTTAVTISGRF